MDMNYNYETLSPWAETDPVPLRGLTARLDTLANKKIGLFRNFKDAALPIMTVVEQKLKQRFPDCEISSFYNPAAGVNGGNKKERAEFEEWVDTLDAVILAVGD